MIYIFLDLFLSFLILCFLIGAVIKYKRTHGLGASVPFRLSDSLYHYSRDSIRTWRFPVFIILSSFGGGILFPLIGGVGGYGFFPEPGDPIILFSPVFASMNPIEKGIFVISSVGQITENIYALIYRTPFVWHIFFPIAMAFNVKRYRKLNMIEYALLFLMIIYISGLIVYGILIDRRIFNRINGIWDLFNILIAIPLSAGFISFFGIYLSDKFKGKNTSCYSKIHRIPTIYSSIVLMILIVFNYRVVSDFNSQWFLEYFNFLKFSRPLINFILSSFFVFFFPRLVLFKRPFIYELKATFRFMIDERKSVVILLGFYGFFSLLIFLVNELFFTISSNYSIILIDRIIRDGLFQFGQLVILINFFYAVIKLSLKREIQRTSDLLS